MAELVPRYVNDEAKIDDGFGPERVGDLVARMALEADAPFTIGVTGKWGAGKTSVLRRAFATLGGEPIQQTVPLGKKARPEGIPGWDGKIWKKRTGELQWGTDLEDIAERSLAIWYSPWQHQGAENPVLPLLLEIQTQFSVRMKMVQKLSDANRRGGLAGLALLERVIDASLGFAMFGRPTNLAKGTSEAVRKAWREAAPEEPKLSDGQRFHLLFEDAIETLLAGLPGRKRKSEGRLIIFIDDLDRCEESAIVELLEAIKLYLGTQRCIFVLGVDENAVESALARHWERSGDSNREYLEKLFQAIVSVPAPRSDKVKTFLRRQLTRHSFQDAANCAELIHDLLEPNPRKLKNFVNAVCANWTLFLPGCPEKPEAASNHEQRFILMQYLRTHHRAVWRLLERQPRSLPILTLVLNGGAETELGQLDLKEIDPRDQRLLWIYFRRSFAHALRDPGDSTDAEHHHLPMSEAVTLFEERIDRKRSDDCFIRTYRELITNLNDREILDSFLCLPEIAG